MVPALLLMLSVGTVLAGGMSARYGLSWPRRLYWPRPGGIVLHHSASAGMAHGRPVDAALIDHWHEERGWGSATVSGAHHIGYHYVILPDGSVQPGRPEWMLGAHCLGYNDHLGICLVGDFSSSSNPDGRIKPSAPTREQLRALDDLLRSLMHRYGLGPEAIRRHRDLGQTACPGDRFPFDAVIEGLSGEGRGARGD